MLVLDSEEPIRVHRRCSRWHAGCSDRLDGTVAGGDAQTTQVTSERRIRASLQRSYDACCPSQSDRQSGLLWEPSRRYKQRMLGIVDGLLYIHELSCVIEGCTRILVVIRKELISEGVNFVAATVTGSDATSLGRC